MPQDFSDLMAQDLRERDVKGEKGRAERRGSSRRRSSWRLGVVVGRLADVCWERVAAAHGCVQGRR
jgi:hypothetical protein